MAEPDALCDPIATTSLYEDERSGHSAVLSLEEAAAEYARLAPPVADAAPEHRDAAPFLVVQLRKRRGKVEVFLDDYLSEAQPVTRDGREVHVHELHWHHGLHEDPQTRTRVLSPIAVACAVEDGQRLLSNVKVGVWQSYLGLEEKAEWLLVSEANLPPHRVSDTRCRTVATPYPVAYHPHPTVSVTIDRKGRQKRNNERMRLTKEFTTLVATQSMANFNPGITTGVEASDMFIGGLLVSAVFAYASQTLHELMGPFPAMLAITLMQSSIALRDAYGNYRSAADEQAAAAAMNRLIGATAGTVATTLTRYITFSRNTPPAKARFTLPEFAKTLEMIAAILSQPPSDDPQQAQNYLQTQRSPWGRNEWMLWDWMASYKAGTQTSAFDSSDLLFQHTLGTRLHIVIDIKDEFECASTSTRHELRCTRDDAYYLGSAASGTLHDLQRVRKAIVACQGILGLPKDRSWLDPVYDAIDYVGKSLGTLKDFVTQIFSANSLQGVLSSPVLNRLFQVFAGEQTKLLTAIHKINRNEKEQAKHALATFADCFLDESGDGTRLLRRIELALRSKGRPEPSPADAPVCRRLLPQRVGRSNFVYLFRSGQPLSTHHVDMLEDLGPVVREFSDYDEATRSLQTATKSGFAYLRRFAPQWEARSATRVALACACRSVAGFDELDGPAGAPICSTLAIGTPVDIHFAGAVSRVMEQSLRRIRFVVKRAQQRCDPSLLEALGLKHTSEDLLACQIFGDLWADELVALHKSKEVRRSQMQMLEQASRRAAARLRALGALLLEVFTVLPQTELGAEDENEIAPEVSDVAFRATLAGRDAALLVGKLLFARDDFEMRSVMTPIVRRAAAAAVRAAAVFERAVPVRLPHEPLASLFGARSEGVAAFLRASQLMADDVVARRAVVAAYASARLLSNDHHDEALRRLSATPPSPWRRAPEQSVEELLGFMRHRMASLRMDHDPLDVAERLGALDLGALTDELAVARGIGHEFYVPFGFGDARPAPTLPPCPAPMFGTVPVMSTHLRDAFNSIAAVLKATDPSTGAAANGELRVRLAPELRCLAPLLRVAEEERETSSAHPNVVQVLPMTADRRIEARFSASRSRSDKVRADDNGSKSERSRDLADAHQCNRASLDMAHEVSSIAWNAERVVQCVVAALASAKGTNDLDTIGIELILPDDANYLESWYNKQPQEAVDRALRNLAQKKSDLDVANQVWTSVTVRKQDIRTAMQTLAKNYKSPKVQGVALTLVTEEPEYKELERQLADTELALEAARQSYDRHEQAVREAQNELNNARRAFDEAGASTKRSQRVLLGSVGIGMAMLSALVASAGVRVEMRFASVRPEGVATGADEVAARCNKCEAMRLSEACLLISQTL